MTHYPYHNDRVIFENVVTRDAVFYHEYGSPSLRRAVNVVLAFLISARARSRHGPRRRRSHCSPSGAPDRAGFVVCVSYPSSSVVAAAATNIRRHEGRTTGIDVEQSVFWRTAKGVRARQVRHFPVWRIATHTHTHTHRWVRGEVGVTAIAELTLVLSQSIGGRLEIFVYFFALSGVERGTNIKPCYNTTSCYKRLFGM